MLKVASSQFFEQHSPRVDIDPSCPLRTALTAPCLFLALLLSALGSCSLRVFLMQLLLYFLVTLILLI